MFGRNKAEQEAPTRFDRFMSKVKFVFTWGTVGLLLMGVIATVGGNYIYTHPKGKDIEVYNTIPSDPAAQAPIEIQYRTGTSGTCSWELYPNGELEIRPINGTSGYLETGTEWPIPTVLWHAEGVDDTAPIHLVVKSGVKAPEDSTGLFAGYKYISSADMERLDMSHVKVAAGMFSGCTALKTLSCSMWELSELEDASYMFAGCTVLDNMPTFTWRLSSVKDARAMFKDCLQLRRIDADSWGLQSLEKAEQMFDGCPLAESLDMSEWELKDGVEDIIKGVKKETAVGTGNPSRSNNDEPDVKVDHPDDEPADQVSDAAEGTA